MPRVNLLALAAATILAFVASSLWYSPLLFGRQFLELSGIPQSQPNAVKALLELTRTSILAYVIARLLMMLNIADWKGALRLGLGYGSRVLSSFTPDPCFGRTCLGSSPQFIPGTNSSN